MPTAWSYRGITSVEVPSSQIDSSLCQVDRKLASTACNRGLLLTTPVCPPIHSKTFWFMAILLFWKLHETAFTLEHGIWSSVCLCSWTMVTHIWLQNQLSPWKWKLCFCVNTCVNAHVHTHALSVTLVSPAFCFQLLSFQEKQGRKNMCHSLCCIVLCQFDKG